MRKTIVREEEDKCSEMGKRSPNKEAIHSKAARNVSLCFSPPAPVSPPRLPEAARGRDPRLVNVYRQNVCSKSSVM